MIGLTTITSNLNLRFNFLLVGIKTNRLVQRIRNRLQGGDGQTMTEYALLLSAVAMVLFVTFKSVGTSTTAVLGKVDGDL